MPETTGLDHVYRMFSIEGWGWNISLQTCDSFVVVCDVKLVRSDILRFVVEVE